MRTFIGTRYMEMCGLLLLQKTIIIFATKLVFDNRDTVIYQCYHSVLRSRSIFCLCVHGCRFSFMTAVNFRKEYTCLCLIQS